MNFALPALVIVLGLLPGICCFFGYFARRFDKRVAGVGGVEEVALYIVLAVPIDAFALMMTRHFGRDLDFEVILHMLGGSLSDAAIAHAENLLRAGSGVTAVIYSVVLVCSFGLGVFARRVVWAFRLDTFVPLLAIRHAHYYTLQGRLNNRPRDIVPVVDVLMRHPDGSRLYRGIVEDFEITPSGSIQSLTLAQAMRGKRREDQFNWVTIPGDRLTLMGTDLHSINVRYVELSDEASGKSRWDRLQRSTIVIVRSFCFHEP